VAVSALRPSGAHHPSASNAPTAAPISPGWRMPTAVTWQS